MTGLTDLSTPCLLLDRARLLRNIARLKTRLAALGVPLRPHLKSCKNIEIARLLTDQANAPVTVSTLREAAYFAQAGYKDILYAVGISPRKLDQVADLRRAGCDLSIILDSIEQACVVAQFAGAAGMAIPVLIEVDTDGHRSGVQPDSDLLTAIASILADGSADLRGVMAHAGGSYGARSEAELIAAAETERAQSVRAATRLREAGHACPVVSVGSTPTAHFAQRLDGVTEVRAGVFAFFDLVMVGAGVCSVDDIALSVLATVIGHRDDGSLIVDAGWMAMSRDRGTARQVVDQGYGLVADRDGRPLDDLIMLEANQEHGIIGSRRGGKANTGLQVGSLVRIYPNHACATAAQFDAYQVLDEQNQPVAHWQRIRGW